ncbi:hypothetical protein LCGC14_2076470 [marine sediment metagenome]|uniref:Uncharacterized protein n=1 Tax=marine sediment metagenome TaxID=412755 RepID=A0A0F9EGU0_9ZZZZ
MSKAASEGARHLTPKVVMEVLAKLGVERVNDLDQAQRRKFVAKVKQLVDELPEQREAPADDGGTS